MGRAWPTEHDDALRRHLDAGMSHNEAAEEINREFSTSYSRNAAIGRAHRRGWQGLANAKRKTKRKTKPPVSPNFHPKPIAAVPQIHLRCAEVEPLNIALVDLEPHHCRWPVSGEREHTLFCGHVRLEAYSYCPAHQRLAVGPGTASERRAA